MNSDLYLLLTFCNYKNSGWEMLSQSTKLSKGKSGVKPRSILLQSLHVLTTMIHYSGRVVFALYYLFFFFHSIDFITDQPQEMLGVVNASHREGARDPKS